MVRRTCIHVMLGLSNIINKFFSVPFLENGLYRTRLIDRVLIDYFIPFLPMERKHIMQCIQAEAQRHNAEGMFDYE